MPWECRADLIAGARIPRTEADNAADAPVRGSKKRVVVISAAGLGKSCTVAQTVDCLRGEAQSYWNRHLDGADSELIVRSGHDVINNPEAIAEVIRILHEHLPTTRQ